MPCKSPIVFTDTSIFQHRHLPSYDYLWWMRNQTELLSARCDTVLLNSQVNSLSNSLVRWRLHHRQSTALFCWKESWSVRYFWRLSCPRSLENQGWQRPVALSTDISLQSANCSYWCSRGPPPHQLGPRSKKPFELSQGFAWQYWNWWARLNRTPRAFCPCNYCWWAWSFHFWFSSLPLTYLLCGLLILFANHQPPRSLLGTCPSGPRH